MGVHLCLELAGSSPGPRVIGADITLSIVFVSKCGKMRFSPLRNTGFQFSTWSNLTSQPDESKSPRNSREATSPTCTGHVLEME